MFALLTHTQPLLSVSFSPALREWNALQNPIRNSMCVAEQKKKTNVCRDMRVRLDRFLWRIKTKHALNSVHVFFFLAAASLSCPFRNGIFMCRGLFFFKCQRDKFMWMCLTQSAHFAGYFGSWSHSSCRRLYSSVMCVSFDKIHIVRLFNYKRIQCSRVDCSQGLCSLSRPLWHHISHNNNYPSN